MTSSREENPAPKVATSWLIGIATLVAGIFGWIAIGIPNLQVKTAAGATPMPLVSIIVFEACLLALGWVCIWGVIVQSSTRLDSSGVSQLSIKGVVRLRWKDVIDLSERRMGLLVVSDGTASVRIASTVYESPDKLFHWIRKCLEQSGASLRK